MPRIACSTRGLMDVAFSVSKADGTSHHGVRSFTWHTPLVEVCRSLADEFAADVRNVRAFKITGIYLLPRK